jgi:predicted TIM-barrel fold metal-dependent hydrolase
VLAPADAVDTHAHVFHWNLPLAANRRYTPSTDAPLAAFLRVLDEHGIGRAVLVQPSFLGTEHDYLLDAVAEYPDRLRGVAVLSEAADEAELERLHASGILGVRLNLIGADVPALTSPPWQRLAARIADLGVHLELQARGEQWTRLEPALQRWPGPVVIDHVGLPQNDDPARSTVRALAAQEHVWVKLSAPYRSAGAGEFAAELIGSIGTQRLLWGSDWPGTQHEHVHDYAQLLRWARDLLGSDEEFASVLRDNPRTLLGWT